MGSADVNSANIVSITASSSRSISGFAKRRNFVAGAAQALIPFAIGIEPVLRSIDFDNEMSLWATKIDDEAADRVLTAELAAVELAVTKEVPKLRLGGRLPVPELAGAYLHCCRGTPAPSPTVSSIRHSCVTLPFSCQS